MLKAGRGGHRILCFPPLFSNYCSPLTDDKKGTQWVAWQDPIAVLVSAWLPFRHSLLHPLSGLDPFPSGDPLGTGCAFQQPPSSPAQQIADLLSSLLAAPLSTCVHILEPAPR